jgi:hypothetical protein
VPWAAGHSSARHSPLDPSPAGLDIRHTTSYRFSPAERSRNHAPDVGAGLLPNYLQIALPLARPALITVGLFRFVASWNDFFGRLVYLSDSRMYTLPVAIRFYQGLAHGGLRPDGHDLADRASGPDPLRRRTALLRPRIATTGSTG